MTPERIAEIRRRVDAATPGPWRWADWMTTFGEVERPDSENWRYLEACEGGDDPRMRERDSEPALILVAEDPLERKPDAMFIAHARQDVPDLLDALAATEARATAAEQDRDRLHACWQTTLKDGQRNLEGRQHWHQRAIASEARVTALEAALRKSEQTTVIRVAGRRTECGDCGRRGVVGGEVIHAPDCPFALLAPADAAPIETPA